MRRKNWLCRIDAPRNKRTNEQTFFPPPERRERRGRKVRGGERVNRGGRKKKKEKRRIGGDVGRRAARGGLDAEAISRDKRHHRKAKVNTRCAIVCHGRARNRRLGTQKRENRDETKRMYTHRDGRRIRGWERQGEGGGGRGTVRA